MYKHIAKPLETNLTALNIQEKLVRAACTFKQFMMVDLRLSNVSHIDDRLPRSHLTFSWFTLLHYVRVCYHTRFFFNFFFFGHKVYPTQLYGTEFLNCPKHPVFSAPAKKQTRLDQ